MKGQKYFSHPADCEPAQQGVLAKLLWKLFLHRALT
jgi:hypothetical protein